MTGYITYEKLPEKYNNPNQEFYSWIFEGGGNIEDESDSEEDSDETEDEEEIFQTPAFPHSFSPSLLLSSSKKRNHKNSPRTYLGEFL